MGQLVLYNLRIFDHMALRRIVMRDVPYCIVGYLVARADDRWQVSASNKSACLWTYCTSPAQMPPVASTSSCLRHSSESCFDEIGFLAVPDSEDASFRLDALKEVTFGRPYGSIRSPPVAQECRSRRRTSDDSIFADPRFGSEALQGSGNRSSARRSVLWMQLEEIHITKLEATPEDTTSCGEFGSVQKAPLIQTGLLCRLGG